MGLVLNLTFTKWYFMLNAVIFVMESTMLNVPLQTNWQACSFEVSLTISDPQPCSITLIYPDFFIRTINMPLIETNLISLLASEFKLKSKFLSVINWFNHHNMAIEICHYQNTLNRISVLSVYSIKRHIDSIQCLT